MEPNLPFTSWRLSRPERAAPLAAAIIGATLGFPAALLIFERQLREPTAGIFVTFTTALLSYLILRRAITRERSAAAVTSVLLWCVPAAAVNAGLAFQFLVESAPPLLPFAVATFIGLVWAAPLGIAFGGAYAVLAHHALHGATTRSHQSADVLLGNLGVAVLLAGIARAAWVGDLASVVPVALGAVGALAAFGRAIRRRRWVADLANGNVDGFSLVSADAQGDDALPCLVGDPRFASSVVVYDKGESATYRRQVRAPRRLARVS
ncbi:MAG: hypothetical protein JNL21_00320 [Myxococcales bacterium]|nr:hypothetical protein [Myxococcales bacterium]